MAARSHRYSPFDRHQSSSMAADRNAPGRSAASPGVGNSAGRTPSSDVEMVHAQASLQGQVGRHLSGVPSGWVGDASAVQPADLLHLAARLTQGARDAGMVARNTEILAARLSAALPEGQSYKGVAYAVNQHAEHAQLLADAHAVVVRLAAYPEILDVLAALERGATVIVSADADDAPSLSRAAGNRSARTDAVGGEHNPTLRPRKLWSGLLEIVSAGHRKSSSPAHQSAPVPVDEHHHGSRIRCGKPLAGNGQ